MWKWNNILLFIYIKCIKKSCYTISEYYWSSIQLISYVLYVQILNAIPIASSIHYTLAAIIKNRDNDEYEKKIGTSEYDRVHSFYVNKMPDFIILDCMRTRWPKDWRTHERTFDFILLCYLSIRF